MKKIILMMIIVSILSLITACTGGRSTVVVPQSFTITNQIINNSVNTTINNTFINGTDISPRFTNVTGMLYVNIEADGADQCARITANGSMQGTGSDCAGGGNAIINNSNVRFNNGSVLGNWSAKYLLGTILNGSFFPAGIGDCGAGNYIQTITFHQNGSSTLACAADSTGAGAAITTESIFRNITLSVSQIAIINSSNTSWVKNSQSNFGNCSGLNTCSNVLYNNNQTSWDLNSNDDWNGVNNDTSAWHTLYALVGWKFLNDTSNYLIQLASNLSRNDIMGPDDNLTITAGLGTKIINGSNVNFALLNISINITLQETNGIIWKNTTTQGIGFEEIWNGTCIIKRNLVSGNNFTLC